MTRPAPAPPPPLLEDARALAMLLRDCALSRVGRHLLMLRLDWLGAETLRPHHLRLVLDALVPLLRAPRARGFQVNGACLAIAWPGDASARLDQVRQNLRHLVADAASFLPADTAEAFISLHQLPAACADVLAMLDRPSAAGPPEAAKPGTAAPIPGMVAPKPLDPILFARLEAGLAQAELGGFLRREPVWAITGEAVGLAWESLVFDAAALSACLVPGRLLTADPWLFRRLGRLLDRRLLAELARPESRSIREGAADPAAGGTGLRLNVASLLGAEFLALDALLGAGARAGFVLECDPVDIAADPAQFLFARDFVRGRGYRLALGLPDPALLPAFPLDRLGLDYLRLVWQPDLARPGVARNLPRQRAGLVLGGVGDAAALGWGMAQGIGLFQGRFADRYARLHQTQAPGRLPALARMGP